MKKLILVITTALSFNASAFMVDDLDIAKPVNTDHVVCNSSAVVDGQCDLVEQPVNGYVVTTYFDESPMCQRYVSEVFNLDKQQVESLPVSDCGAPQGDWVFGLDSTGKGIFVTTKFNGKLIRQTKVGI